MCHASDARCRYCNHGVIEQTGARREQELEYFLQDMLEDGCRLERFENECQSVWDIVGKHSGTTLGLPDEMVERGNPFTKQKLTKILPKDYRSGLWI